MRKLFCSRTVAVASSSSSTTSTSTSSTPEPIGDTTATTLPDMPTRETAVTSPWWHGVLNQSTVTLTTMQANTERQLLSSMGFTAIVVTIVFLLVVLLVVCCLVRTHRQASPERLSKTRFEDKLSLESTNHQNPLYSEIESELTWDGSGIRVHADKRKRNGTKVTREKSLKFTNPDMGTLKLMQHNRNLESRGQFFDGLMSQGQDQRGAPPSRLRPILAVNPSETSDIVYNYGVGVENGRSAPSKHSRFLQGHGSDEGSATYSTASRAPTEPIYALAAKTNPGGMQPSESTKQALPFLDTSEMEHFIDNFPVYEAAAAFPTSEDTNAIYASASPHIGEVVNAIYSTASQCAGEDDVQDSQGLSAIYATAAQLIGDDLIVPDGTYGDEDPSAIYSTASQCAGDDDVQDSHGLNAIYATASQQAGKTGLAVSDGMYGDEDPSAVYSTASQCAGEDDGHGDEGLSAIRSTNVGDDLIIPDGHDVTYVRASDTG